MTYYLVNEQNKIEGPFDADSIRAKAQPLTLISHGERWIPLSQHPEFGPILQGTCPSCGSPLKPEVRFCTACGANTTGGGPTAVVAPAVASTRQAPSPHLALLNLIIPGIAQIAFGQTMKGVVLILLYLFTLPTIFIAALVVILSIIDGYKVGGKLRRSGLVGKWDVFPS